MNSRQQWSSISMVRENLDRIPHFSLPPGYSIRWYQPGDEKLWLEIHLEADPYNAITSDLFTRQFGSDSQSLEDRQCFLFDAHGSAIGTATAWFNDDYNGCVYGRVHWVAVVPGMQGKGLAKPLMTVVCNRLRELRHNRAYLTTSTVRIAAINLYRKFGFAPEIKNAKDLDIWRSLLGTDCEILKLDYCN